MKIKGLACVRKVNGPLKRQLKYYLLQLHNRSIKGGVLRINASTICTPKIVPCASGGLLTTRIVKIISY